MREVQQPAIEEDGPLAATVTLEGATLREAIGELAGILVRTVEAGASVSFLLPFTQAEGERFFESVAQSAERGERIVIAARVGEGLVGTVQVLLAMPPNQPHRAEIAKLLVDPASRKRGIGRLLMERAEREALARGRNLLVFDTVRGEAGERLYRRMGYVAAGVIPKYALYPDGRLCDTVVFYKHL
jgi:GNAT superfamily N-acetyltransferase